MKEHIQLLRQIRTTLVKELDGLSLEQLNYIPESHKNNIVWNIGHCLVVQQLLCYGLSNLTPYVDKSIGIKYKKGSAPEAPVTQEEVDWLKEMLLKSVDLLEKDLEEGKFQTFKPYTVGFGTHLTSIEDTVRFNNVHEGIHYGYLLALKKLL
ncbi:DinB family protein [Aureispira sp. CCB-E]|uniref:DinB family protein n=1 Tax=Aureispira sp. CCB-E TaxID=3051121 RepID=UPI0028686884|nr:DinB family protein [Aureispira sp. CCB-E]WMX14122.1 DinB family protein [Aureispira sp. CCB-E]